MTTNKFLFFCGLDDVANINTSDDLIAIRNTDITGIVPGSQYRGAFTQSTSKLTIHFKATERFSYAGNPTTYHGEIVLNVTDQKIKEAMQEIHAAISSTRSTGYIVVASDLEQVKNNKTFNGTYVGTHILSVDNMIAG